MFCSLLPALWLLAAGHCLADQLGEWAGGSPQTLVPEADYGDHAPLTDVRSFEQSARMLNRRMGTLIGWGFLPVPVVISTSGFADLEHVSAPLTVSTEALGLARCWQFRWRTASEPRAPSSVS